MGQGTKRIGLCLIFAAAGTIFGTGCKPERRDAAPVPPATMETRGELRILSATPQGESEAAGETDAVVVIFDHPMAALEALPEGPGASFLVLKPEVPGRHRWLGTRALAFTPERRLPLGTEFEVRIPAGTRSLDGYVLGREYRWMFRTARPRLIRHVPGDGENNLTLDTRILLVFSQAVSPRDARERIALLEDDPEAGTRDVGTSLSRPAARELAESAGEAAPPENALVLAPSEKLKAGCVYRVRVEAGLVGREGPLGSREEAVFSFETFKTFVFEGLRDEPDTIAPSEPLKLAFSNPVPYRNLVGKLRFEPAVALPEAYGGWDHGNEVLWLNLPLEPDTAYAAILSPDLEDQFGNKLGREAVARFRTGDYPPSVSMVTGHGVVEAYGDLRYALDVRNVSKVGLQAAVVEQGEAVALLQAPNVLWGEKPYAARPGFFSVARELAIEAPRNKRQAMPIDLKEAVPGGHGLVYLQIDTGSKDSWDRYQRAFLQVTELGLTGKFAPETNVIWVTELRTGEPAGGAAVEIRDGANAVRWRGVAGPDGRVVSPGWKTLGLKARDEWSKPVQWVFARRGRDLALLSSDWGTGLSPYRFGIDYDWNPEPSVVEGSVFTERGIYRAGETVHVKGMIRVREKGDWRLPAVREVACEVQDPFEKPFFKTAAALDEFGGFAFDLETRDDASLGPYAVAVIVPGEKPGDKGGRLQETFRLEAFRAAEFEVGLRTLRDAYVFGEEFRGEIAANYLAGGAMGGRPAEWHLRIEETPYTPPGHRGFVFGNEVAAEESQEEGEGRESSRLLASGRGTLDARGSLEVRAVLAAEKERDSAAAVLEATVENPSRKSISGRVRAVVHRGEFYLGLRPATSFLTKGRDLAVEAVAADPAGSLVDGRKAVVRLIRREWRSVQKSGAGGRFGWLSEKEDTEVGAESLTSRSTGPVTVVFRPDRSGLYILKAEAVDGRRNPISTSTYIYVAGEDYVAWERSDDDALDLVADAENYKPGDVARILVKSPFEKAKALVTIERERILESRIQEIRGSAATLDIPLTAEHLPNVFVSVLLVSGRTADPAAGGSDDRGRPGFKMGYVKLVVDPGLKRLAVEAGTDKPEYRPRDRVNLKIRVRDAAGRGRRASVAVAVADVGVLNLIGFQTPDPFARFYAQKALSVETAESRQYVVGQRAFGEKGEDQGGGGERKLMAAGAPLSQVELRGDFKSTAYWNPSLVTDENGDAEASFELPDNLTSFRVMAVAQTKESEFGRGDSQFRVAKLLRLLPSLPRFARVGDAFNGGVVVQNFSRLRGQAELGLEASGLACSDSKPRLLTLDPGESREVLFPFEAMEAGRARLAFRARLGTESDGLEATLPVKLPRPTETVALASSTEDSAEERIRVPQEVFPGETRLDVRASASALAGLTGSLDYLRDYPYLCLEQRLSGLLPYLVAGRVIADFRLSPLSPDEIRRSVRDLLRDLPSYQKDGGGFALWPDSPNASPFASCYAVFALLKAKEAGYEIDAYRLGEGLRYLRNLVLEKSPESASPYPASAWKTTLAFALYDLSLAGRPEAAAAEQLLAERSALSIFGRTLLFKALGKAPASVRTRSLLLEELLDMIKVSPSSAHFEEPEEPGLGWIYSSNVRTTALVLQALVEAGETHPLLPQIVSWLVEKRRADRWSSTQENFYVFYALSAYYDAFEGGSPDFKFRIALDGLPLLEDAFREATSAPRTAGRGLSEAEAGTEKVLIFRKEGAGRLYYGARLTYAPKSSAAARDEGLAVVKRIETLDGQPIATVRAGALAVVRLDIVLPRESLYVVVDDPLPAGFEAVNPVFVTESAEAAWELARGDGGGDRWWEGFSHIELRDDRTLLFADSLRAGVHTHRYLVRALVAGRFLAPGTKAEEMYAPEVFGRGPEAIVRIEK